ncbi:hypothetical protein BDW22DRAFT_1357597 [Trametopsis cervina]|nr:hypothetical protein BDW22DRAFT_1357597 [Trametopsis cervina]
MLATGPRLHLAQALQEGMFSISKDTRHTLLLFTLTDDDVAALGSMLLAIPQGTAYTIASLHSNNVITSGLTDVDEALVEKDGHTYVAYHPLKQGFRTFIVRPDGVIGAVTKDVSGLKKCFSALLSR